MRQKTKKIALLASFMSLMLVVLTAFQVTALANEDKIYAGVGTAEDFETICQNYMGDAFSMSDADIQYFLEQINSEEPGPVTFLVGYTELKEEAGEFEDYTDFTIDETNGIVTAVQGMEFSGGSYEFTLTYDPVSGIPVTSFAKKADENTGFGDKMAKAGMNTLMGLFTVFVVLVVMIFIISLFKYISPKEKKRETVSSFESQVKEREMVQEKKTDDTELVAVIAAAIAASTGKATDSFVVRSIKRR